MTLMKKNLVNIFVDFLVFLIVYSMSSTKNEKKELKKEPMSVSVSKWEYCEGCKETVNLYTRSLAKRLETMHRTGVKPNSQLTATTSSTTTNPTQLFIIYITVI